MKRLRSIVLTGLMTVFAVTGVVHVGEYGHYAPFLMGIRDYFGLNFIIKF